MAEWKKTTSPEEMKKQGMELGAKMMAWTKKNEASFVDKGLPLGKNRRMTSAGAQDVTNDLNYMCVMQADSAEALEAILKDNPHFDIPTSYLDIMEVSHMGM